MSNTIIEILFFFGSALLSLLLYPIWIRFTYKYQLGEEIRPSGPETHIAKRGTPTMGGVVFLIVVSSITFLLNTSRAQTAFPLFIASLAGLFGMFEDMTKVYRHLKITFTSRVKKLSFSTISYILEPFRKVLGMIGSKTYEGDLQSHQKFLIELAIGAFVAYWTYIKLGWDYIWTPFLGNIHIGLGYPIFIILLFLLILNCVAFTDGLDGLAGGLGFIALVSFWFISYTLGYGYLATYCATFSGALLPFLYFNTHPARIFMGNVGSHALGATLAILAIVLHREAALLFICAVFLADGISSPIQLLSKNLTGKKIFRMAPIHHHFEMLGWPETKVVFRFLIIGIFFSFVGIFVALL